MTVGELLEILDELFPWELAEEWDNSGLQVGSWSAECEGILCALDPSSESVEAAFRFGCNVLLAHHPLFFGKAVQRIDTAHPIGKAVRSALERKVNIITCHTNADSAEKGIASYLARAIGLRGISPVEPSKTSRFVKIAVFVPREAVESVCGAMAEAGAGVIGDYTHCSFRTEGTGTFIPQEGASPYSGEVLKLNLEDETRLEMICPSYRIERVVSAMISVHPYEEVAYDLYPLDNPVPWGIGRIGNLQGAKPCSSIIRDASGAFGSDPKRIIGDDEKNARVVAVIPGDADRFVPRMEKSGADLLIAGEISYHSELLADEFGICVALWGHSESENIFSRIVSSELEAALAAAAQYVKIIKI